MSTEQNIATMPAPATSELPARRLLHSRGSRSLVLSGSIVMLVGTVLVSAVNFGYNVTMARMPGSRRKSRPSARK